LRLTSASSFLYLYVQAFGFIYFGVWVVLQRTNVMTDEEAQVVWQTIMDYLHEYPKTLPNRDWLKVVTHIRGNTACHCDEDDLRMVVAMSLLGPHDSCPPGDLRNQLLCKMRNLQQQTAQNQLDRVFEYTLAWGCGWDRKTARGGDWYDVWGDAVSELAKTLVKFVKQTDLWVAALLELHKYGVKQGIQEWSREAIFLANWLAEPLASLPIGQNESLILTWTRDGFEDADYYRQVPSGGKVVFSFDSQATVAFKAGSVAQVAYFNQHGNQVNCGSGAIMRLASYDGFGSCQIWSEDKRDRDHVLTNVELKPYDSLEIPGPAQVSRWLCGCGNERCADRHRMSSWKPLDRRAGSLWSFGASAVKGPHVRFKPKTYIAGMKAALLANMGVNSG